MNPTHTAHDASTAATRTRELLDYFMPTDTPSDEQCIVLGRIAATLTLEQVHVLGDYIETMRERASAPSSPVTNRR